MVMPEEKKRKKRQELPAFSGWRFTDDIYDDEGNLLNYLAISPSGRAYFKIQFEELQAAGGLETGEAPLLKGEAARIREAENFRAVSARLFPELFEPTGAPTFQPPRPELALTEMFERDTEGFLRSLPGRGNAEDVQAFLKAIGAEGAIPEVTPPRVGFGRFIEESPFPDMDMDELAKLAEQDFGGFLDKFSEGGWSRDKESLLRDVGFSPEDVEKIIGPALPSGFTAPKETPITRIQQEKIAKMKAVLKSPDWKERFQTTPEFWDKAAWWQLAGGSMTAAIGGMASGLSGAAGRVKLKGIQKELGQIAEVAMMQRPQLEPFKPGAATLIDPKFWLTQGVELGTYMTAMVPIFLIGMAVGGPVGAAIAGVSAFGRLGPLLGTIFTALVGSAGATIAEATIEAGEAFNEAERRGFTQADKIRAFDSVFGKNVTLLSGSNAVELFLSVLPGPQGAFARLMQRGWVRAISKGGRVVGGVLTEGGEEALQTAFTRQALGEKVVWDDDMKMVAMLGAIGGASFVGGGQIYTSITGRIQSKMTPEQKAEFDRNLAEASDAGFENEQAVRQALDKFASDKEGQAKVEEAVKEELKKQQLNAIQPKDKVEALAIEKLKQKVAPEVAPEAVPTVPKVEPRVAVPEWEVTFTRSGEPSQSFRMQAKTGEEARALVKEQHPEFGDLVGDVRQAPQPAVTPKLKPEAVTPAPEVTAESWANMPVAERLKLIRSKGLEDSIALIGNWEGLTTEQRSIITGKPELPITPIKMTNREWAEGILAIAELSKETQAVTAPKPSAKAIREAHKILGDIPVRQRMPKNLKDYINRIKNVNKKQYAQDYAEWVLKGEVGVAPRMPLEKLGFMAQQSVEMEIRDRLKAIAIEIKPEPAIPKAEAPVTPAPEVTRTDAQYLVDSLKRLEKGEVLSEQELLKIRYIDPEVERGIRQAGRELAEREEVLSTLEDVMSKSDYDTYRSFLYGKTEEGKLVAQRMAEKALTKAGWLFDSQSGQWLKPKVPKSYEAMIDALRSDAEDLLDRIEIPKVAKPGMPVPAPEVIRPELSKKASFIVMSPDMSQERIDFANNIFIQEATKANEGAPLVYQKKIVDLSPPQSMARSEFASGSKTIPKGMAQDWKLEEQAQTRLDDLWAKYEAKPIPKAEPVVLAPVTPEVAGEEAGLPLVSVPEETILPMPDEVTASEDRVVMPPAPPKEPPPPEPPRTHPSQPAPIEAGRITMPDLQAPQTVVDIYSRPDLWRRVANLPLVKKAVGLFNPAAVANNPAKQAIILRAALKDEGAQKAQAVMSHLWEIGTQERVWGKTDEMGLLTKEPFVGLSLDDIRQNPQKSLPFMTEQQKEWIKRASEIEKAKLEALKRNEIEINELSFEDGGEYAGRRVMGKFNDSGELIESGRIGVGGRVGAKMPFEKTRIFKEASDGIIAGYRYMNSDEALYYNTIGAYNKIADKQMAEWILSKVDWRTTKAPEALVLQAEAARLRLRKAQQLLAAVNRAVRGERVPSNTINSIATAYADQADTLNALIPELQKPSPETANIVKTLSAEAKALISEARVEYYQAVNERARAREEARRLKYEEASIAHPAFAGKIFTGAEAKEIADILNRGLTPQFIEALGAVNKVNAIGRFFMLAGDVSPMTIQLQFLAFYRPVAYAKAMGGFVRAMYDPEFQYRYYANNRDLINRHPTLILSGRGTEFTEFMGRGGLGKKLGVLAKPLVPFQKAFEGSIDVAGIELAKSLDHLATTPERTLDVDQFINEFRGITSSARIGVSSTQRQVETAILLAPRYNRAIAAYLFDIVHGGVRGKLARMSLAQGLAGISAMAVAISIALGEDEDEIWQHFDPRSPKFFTWDVLGVKIGLGGKVRSILKTFGNMLRTGEVGQPALNFLRGNLSPGASTGLDLLTGKNYIGEPTRDNVLNFSRTILRNFMMIWTQNFLLEGGTLKEKGVIATAEFLGLRGYDISAKKELKIKDLADRLGELVGKTPVLSKKKPDIYDTRNIFSDVKTLLKNIPPEDVLADKGFAPWGHLVVYIEKSEPKTLPDIALKDYNFDKAKGDTFADYTAQWTERQRIEDAGERAVYVRVKIVEGKEERTTFRGLQALNAHKVDYPNAQRGNLSKRDRELLLEYNAAVDKKQFIKDHPQLGGNPRIEALRKDTELNAKLAIFGQAKIYSREANKKAWALVKELDIPESAIPPGVLVSQEIEDDYFDYEDTVEKWGANSPEARLMRAKNKKLFDFLNEGREDKLEEITEPIPSLEIKAMPRFREINDKLDALKDEDSPDFKDDKIKDKDGLTARDRAQKELMDTKVDGDMTFRDLGRKIEAINKGTKGKPTDEGIIKKHIEFMRKQDEPGIGASSAEVMLYRVDNLEYDKWRMDKEIWGDKVLQAIDRSKIPIWRIDVKMAALDKDSPEYARLNRQRDAHINGFSDIVDVYVDWYETPKAGYHDDWFLMENKDFYDRMVGKGLLSKRDFSKVPDIKWRDEWDTMPPRKQEAIIKGIPELLLDDYVAYFEIPPKPTDYPTGFPNWEDDWWMMEHPDFYKEVYLKILGKPRKDYRKVPTREVWAKYLHYDSLDFRAEQDKYRLDNPDLDEWGVLYGIWTETMTEKRRRLSISGAERMSADIEKRLKELEEAVRSKR